MDQLLNRSRRGLLAAAAGLTAAASTPSLRAAMPPPGAEPIRLALLRFDSKGQADEALSVLRSALDQRIGFVLQGNSSGIAGALIDALNKHNEPEPAARAVPQGLDGFPDPRDDYLHARMQALVELLVHAIERAGSTDAVAVAQALEGLPLDTHCLGALAGFHEGTMRAADHPFQQPLYVSVMGRAGTPGIAHDVKGSGYGFRTLRRFEDRDLEQATDCRMLRPD